MPPNRTRRISDKSNCEHKWTPFEKHTLLCLMAKGLHLEGPGKRSDEPSSMRRNAYLNVATELNQALNGKSEYGQDIDKRDVTKMIDRMLDEKKGVVGKGGYMERATSGRVTRGLKKMWEREPSFDYDGSLSEWKQWRKDEEVEKKRIAEGGEPRSGGGIMESVEGDDTTPGRPAFRQAAYEDIWRGATAAKAKRSVQANDRNQALQTLAAVPQRSTLPAIDSSFNHLSTRLRGNEKFAWADPSRVSTSRPVQTALPLIDSYRPPSSSRDHPYQSSNRHEPIVDSYRPSAQPSEGGHGDYRPSSSSYHFFDSQSQSAPRNETFDFHSDTIMSTPSLTYSSSPAKASTYTGTARPNAARPATARTATTTNPFEETHLARTIQHEMSQRKSSEYKKPGILKRRAEVNDSTDRDDRTRDGINPARRAMLATGGDEDMSYEGVEQALRPVGKGANKEDLPFNRLDSVRRGNGASNVEMGEGGYY